MPIFDLRVHQLAYRGVQEWNLRNIAAGRFTGLVFTRSIPETIFLAKLSHGLRDNGVDLDKVSHVVWTQNNQQPPKKQDDPGAYVAPLVQRIVDMLKPLMPVEQDLYALHQMQALQSDNEKYRKKLAESGIPVTPIKRKAEHPVNDTHTQKKMRFEELPVTYDDLQQAASVVPRVSQIQAVSAKVVKEFQQNAELQLHDGVLSMKLKEYITKVFNSIGGVDKKTKKVYDFEGFLQSFTLSLEIYSNWVTQLIVASPWLYQEMKMPECMLEVHSIMSFTAMTYAFAALLVQQSFSAYEGLTYREFTQRRFRMRILVATLQFIIAYVPGVDKHVMMWATSFAWLVLCTRSSTLDRYSLSLKMRVRSLGLHPSMYSYDFFSSSNIVYMKVPFQFDVAWVFDTKRLTCSTPNRRNWKRYWYIGSSSLTATARDCNRATKLRQVSSKKLVKTELAVQWWSEKDNFLDYATVVLGAFRGWHRERATGCGLNYGEGTVLYTIQFTSQKLVPNMQEHRDLPEMPCYCKEWLQRYPNLSHVNGHIAAGLEEFNLAHDLEKFNWINAQSTFFPAKREYHSMFQDAFDAWWRRNQFPRWSKPDLTEFIHDQWKQHLVQISKEERLDFKSVQKLKRFFKDNFVIHNEDHCKGHVMLFCPNLYYTTQWRTWTDETVFTRLPYAPHEYQQALTKQIPQDLRKRYPWGFKSDPRCPRGYIFMKRKKQWATARTIVSYWNSLAAPLLTAVSMALSSILSSTWPQQLATGTTPQLWSDIHRFLRAQSDTARMVELNQDLIGFFNSIPQTEVVNAVQRLLDECRATHNDTCIMVNPHSHFKRMQVLLWQAAKIIIRLFT
ncbi:unnamed protein product [Symbiodinium sp. CCMP2592]|nr:unnamed protein product [Symbiodinium sp. CCMP2592]